MKTTPTKILMRDGTRVYSYGMSYHEVMRVGEIARRRGDENA